MDKSTTLEELKRRGDAALALTKEAIEESRHFRSESEKSRRRLLETYEQRNTICKATTAAAGSDK